MVENQVSQIDELYDRPFKPYFLQKTDFIVAGVLFVVSFVIYLLTLTPYICAGDSGELTTAIYNLGAAHPPGYPLYTMLGKIFTYIPVSTVAYRVNLVSAFCGALTIPFLFMFLLKLMRTSEDRAARVRDYLIAASCSLLFAFSSTMWSQAVIAEVYTLNIVFAPMLLLAVLMWQERVYIQLRAGKIDFAERFLLLFACLLGMSFTNHLLLVGYIIPFFIFFLGNFIYMNSHSIEEDKGKSSGLFLIVSGVLQFGITIYAVFALRSVLNIWGLLIAAALLETFALFLGIMAYDRKTRLTVRHAGYLMLIFAVVELAAVWIAKYAWYNRLLNAQDAFYTLLAVLLPLIALGVVAVLLQRSLPDHKSFKKMKTAKAFLLWGMLLWTGLLVAVLALPELRKALMFMSDAYDNRGVKIADKNVLFSGLAIALYCVGLVILVFSYFSLRKQRLHSYCFTETVGLVFKGYIFFLLPMLLYLTLLIRANAIAKIPDPPLSWGETANASRVLNHFLRKQYPKSTVQFLPRIFEILGGWGQWHLNQFTILPLLFVPFGLISLFRRNRMWGFLTVAIFVIFNGLLLAFLSPKVNPRDMFFNEVFFIPSYVMVVTWIAFGMQWLVKLVSGFLTRSEDGKTSIPDPAARQYQDMSTGGAA